ncbi:MAG: aldo/keto reductase [Lachnospiraceae bacterium]|nr:aldo/keto reductase [Lachnospiraceae bacterium]
MKMIRIGKNMEKDPAVVVGMMRFSSLNKEEAEHYVMHAVERGANYFDHADIYDAGACEALFGEVLKQHASLREQLVIQSKCGIVPGKMYDLSREHIVTSVDASLKRLHTEYLDYLILHRPDALMDPEEIAYTMDYLVKQGKVAKFGVSNMNPMQLELLLRYVRQPIAINQLQLSLPHSNMIAAGLETNMISEGAINRDGYVLDYCRVHNITVQAWSPFQYGQIEGCFIDDPKFEALNEVMATLAKRYDTSKTAIAAAWIFRHPANMQLVAGTTKEDRLDEIIAASRLKLKREEWYALYMAAGHILP